MFMFSLQAANHLNVESLLNLTISLLNLTIKELLREPFPELETVQSTVEDVN